MGMAGLTWSGDGQQVNRSTGQPVDTSPLRGLLPVWLTCGLVDLSTPCGVRTSPNGFGGSHVWFHRLPLTVSFVSHRGEGCHPHFAER
jgi:hypothetical protein